MQEFLALLGLSHSLGAVLSHGYSTEIHRKEAKVCSAGLGGGVGGTLGNIRSTAVLLGVVSTCTCDVLTHCHKC